MHSRQMSSPAENSDQLKKRALHRAIVTFTMALWLVAILGIIGAWSFATDGNGSNEPVEAAALTVGAQQAEIQRQGEYLSSEAALSATEPELAEYFIDGGLDLVEIESDGPFLSIEYGDNGSIIRLDYLDWNLVNVSCKRIDPCPSAAELQS
jgi:hypothetical protein